MVSKAVELMLADLQEKYDQIPSTRAFDRLYSDPQWARMFAVLHKRLNEHFGSSPDAWCTRVIPR